MTTTVIAYPPHRSAYTRGRKLMTDEVLVAVEALRAGGAKRSLATPVMRSKERHWLAASQ